MDPQTLNTSQYQAPPPPPAPAAPHTSGKKRIIVMSLILFLLVSIPLTIYLVKQQQDNRNRAATGSYLVSGEICGVKVTPREVTSCPSLDPSDPSQTNSLSSYQVGFTLSSTDGKAHKVGLITQGHWCAEPYGVPNSGNPPYVCNSGSQGMSNPTMDVPATGGVEVGVTANSGGAACGSYQVDLAIQIVDDKPSCGVQTLTPTSFGVCQTGISCNATTSTPTPSTETPTPSLTPSVTPSVSPSVTPSLTPSVTPSVSPSVTPSLTPSLTPSTTPGSSATPTPVVLVTTVVNNTSTTIVNNTQVTATPTPVELLKTGGNLPLLGFIGAGLGLLTIGLLFIF